MNLLRERVSAPIFPGSDEIGTWLDIYETEFDEWHEDESGDAEKPGQ